MRLSKEMLSSFASFDKIQHQYSRRDHFGMLDDIACSSETSQYADSTAAADSANISVLASARKPNDTLEYQTTGYFMVHPRWLNQYRIHATSKMAK
jgi:hypothetical protein